MGRQEDINNTMRRYHRSGSTARCSVNAVNISSANSMQHEITKSVISVLMINGADIDSSWTDLSTILSEFFSKVSSKIDFHRNCKTDIITEAVDEIGKRRDIVNLSSGCAIEIVHKHVEKDMYEEYRKSKCDVYKI